MIGIEKTGDNRMYPLPVCDVCKEPIHEQGLFRWDPGVDKRQYPLAGDVVHKGKRDRATDPMHRMCTIETEVGLFYAPVNMCAPDGDTKTVRVPTEMAAVMDRAAWLGSV